MKNILILITLLLNLANANINEHKTDLFFANGMVSNLKTAKDRWIIIRDKLILKYPEVKEHIFNYTFEEVKNQAGIIIDYKKIIKINDEEKHVAYNQTLGDDMDSLEVLLQKIKLNEFDSNNLNELNFSDTFLNIENYNYLLNIIDDENSTLLSGEKLDLPIEIREKIIDYLNNEISKKQTETMQYILNEIENFDLSIQVNQYKEFIEKGHNIVVLAHSQGTAFTERVFNDFKENNDWYTKYFTGYYVGPVTKSVFGKKSFHGVEDYLLPYYDVVFLLELVEPFDFEAEVVPSNLSLYDYKGDFSLLLDRQKAHYFSAYFNTAVDENNVSIDNKQVLDIILNGLKNKILKETETQYEIVDKNISKCEIQTFKHKNLENTTIEAINYKHKQATKISKTDTGQYVMSIHRGYNSKDIDETNINEIPDIYSRNICKHLEATQEFIEGNFTDPRNLVLKKEENYFNQLTLNFTKIYDVEDYKIQYENAETNEVVTEDIKEYTVNSVNKEFTATFTKTFELNASEETFIDIKIIKTDTNETSNPIEFVAKNPAINNSLILEVYYPDIEISWDEEESIEYVNIYVKDGNTTKILEERFTGSNLTYTPENRTIEVTIEKYNKILSNRVTNEITLSGPVAMVYNYPYARLYQDRYDKNNDYILFKYYTHYSKYPNASRVEIVIDGKVYETLYKKDFNQVSTSAVNEFHYTIQDDPELLLNEHSIQLIPYNEYGTKGTPGYKLNMSMPIYSIVPKVNGSIGGSYYEDNYYPSNDYVSYYWQTSAAYYPDVTNLKVYINDTLHATYNREELLQNNGYITYVKYGVSKDSPASIRIVGCDKFNTCIEKNLDIDTSGKDLYPQINTIPTIDTSNSKIIVPMYKGAYYYAFNIEVYKDGSLYGSYPLDRLELGGYEEVPYTEGESGTVTVKVFNRYNDFVDYSISY